ncbi:unnamed protein product [Dicrocoelium dendriticum]|nr:unnamed protein product [Dicrocoelium dendriticum]
MQAVPERVHSDQNKERAHRRKKRRDDANLEPPSDPPNRGSRQRNESQHYNRENRDYFRNKSYDEYDEEYIPQNTEHLDDSFVPASHARRSGDNRHRRSSKPKPPIEENDYVNAPFESDLDQSEQYHDREYGRAEDNGVDEALREQDESFQSDYPQRRASRSHPSRTHQASRDGTFLPINEREPSVLTVSDYGRESAISATPHALGGNEREFWNPEPELDGTVPSNPPLLQHATGLQKFLASFRRFKRAKQSSNAAALSEPNVTDPSSTLARVIMLDGEELSYQLGHNETGQSLLAKVCQTADIVETDYFGLTYVSNKLRTWFWLDADRKISKQLRTPSMHTLNRAHPRDMTLGRAQTSDNVGPRRLTPSQQPFSSARHTGPASQLNGTMPDIVRQSDSQSQLSRHSNGVVEHSLSYGSPRHSYTTGSQSHDYINQRRGPADLSADPSVLTASSLASGHSGHYSQSETSQRKARTATQRRPNSPPSHSTARPSASRTHTGEISRQTRETHAANRKPPTGGVPVLGGVMITESVLARHKRPSIDSSGPTTTTKMGHHREVEPYPEEDENDWDYPVEYDDDELEQPEYPQANAPLHHRPQSRGSFHQSFDDDYDRGSNRDAFLSSHTPRGRSENVELML